MAQKASEKRIKYLLRRNPSDADIPEYARKRIDIKLMDRRQMGVVICALECLNKNGGKLYLRDSMVIHSQLVGDWDYNTLEPYLQQLEIVMLYQAGKMGLNAQRFIDPEDIPQKQVEKAPLI